MSKGTFSKRIADKLVMLQVEEEINKVDLVMELYDVDNYFIRRSFDVHLCKAKKYLKERFPERRFFSAKNDKIKRLTNIS